MEENPVFWLSQFLSRLHPLLVHFPIGLLVVAGFLELLTVGGKRPGLREGITWLVYLGAASALLSAISGLLLCRPAASCRPVAPPTGCRLPLIP